MNIEYVTRSYDLDEKVQAAIEDKVHSKLAKFLDEPAEIRVTLDTEKHGLAIADVHVSHRHGIFQASEETNDMTEAIYQVLDKVEKQARRSRKKFLDQRRRADRAAGGPAERRWPMAVLEPASLAEGSEGPRIVKSTHFDIEPMSVEDAALRLADAKNDFLVFRDADTESVSVLYKRRDGNYGLIDTEA